MDQQWHAAFTALDSRLHDLVASASGNPLLRDSIARLHAHLHLHRRYFPYAQTADTNDEHRKLAAAIRDGLPDVAEAAMREHLTRTRERHLAAFATPTRSNRAAVYRSARIATRARPVPACDTLR